MKAMNHYIDHTLLKNDATYQDIEKLVIEAKDFHFASVCIHPCFVSFCHQLLKDSDVKVCTVIGFPLGASTTACKVFETKDAIKNGADEIDMVINLSMVKEQRYQELEDEIRQVVQASQGRLVKVIIETCLLSDEEIVHVCKVALQAKASFVKTSTGFSTAGANVQDVTLMKQTVKDNMEVKASGGIRCLEDAKAMIDAGASRIGTSAGVKIMEEMK